MIFELVEVISPRTELAAILLCTPPRETFRCFESGIQITEAWCIEKRPTNPHCMNCLIYYGGVHAGH